MGTPEEETPLWQLTKLLENPKKNILPLFDNPSDPESQKKKREGQEKLIGIAQHLFKEIEETAKLFQEVSKRKSANGDLIAPPLSGLPEMYIPEAAGDAPLDTETIWGQVELQNTGMKKLVKKSIKKLAKDPEKIVLIDQDMLDDSDSENDDDQSVEDENVTSGEEDVDEDESDDDEDEEAKRIRQRMERAMEDMETDDEAEDSDGEDETPAKEESKKDDEDLYDPVAEDMKDGFFDLNEMEDFADEEEDFLPDEAYPQTESGKKSKKNKKEKSFHQKQRDGDLLNPSDDDDENDLEDFYEENMDHVKRKKYRDDEDIEALYNLYESKSDPPSEDEKGPADMTAADFFGKPNKKLMERYNTKKAKEEVKDDDDSWGEYDFEKEETGAWPAGKDDEDESEDSEEDDGSQAESDDEEQDGEGDSSGEEDQQTEKSTQEDKSRFAREQAKIKKQTEELEKEMLAEKPWHMTGETGGTSRPVNSLLEGTPEFQMASKQAPTITVEHTENLEEVIKSRILQEDWDDVVPRELPDVGWHKKRGELPEVSQEKSKLGLGELYEREYLKKAVGYDKDAEEKQSAEDKAKDEMKKLFANLCSKLDALSNYHFAPRPIADEAEVRPVTAPAIAMEEVLPLHVSDARGVAPEEVFGAKRGREGVLRGENEMDQNERKRLRQSKKAARRKARKEKLADEKLISRLQPGLGLNNPYEKRKMREELSEARARGRVTTGEKDAEFKYGSSGTFFKRLQEETQMSVRGEDKTQQKKETKRKSESSAFKL